jgi:murein DD-endopeptidase MepM/ murein hydrolase activator NlpD
MAESELINILKEHQHEFAPVVPFDLSGDKLALFDFTAANQDIREDILNDTKEFTAYIDHALKESGARYGIGGYQELRTLYGPSQVFDAVKRDEEPRRLHLGTDIWGKPYTPVMAPTDGILHSFAFNDNFGDYGVTIILSHVLNGISFHTLYGHLSLNSIKNREEGMRIAKGDVFAEFGIPFENGHWPPHLHFQIIRDMGEWKGDYPGVCKFSEKENYLSNCPDPDLVLQFNQYL